MSVTDDDGIPHGLQGYRRFGCKCETCMSANRKYHRDRTARAMNGPAYVRAQREAAQRDVVVQTDKWGRPRKPPPPKPPGESTVSRTKKIGAMEQAVIDECANLPAAQERQTSVVAAQAMARIIDNPKQAALHPTTMRQLTSIMDGLRNAGKGRRKSGGRLATVQKMTRSKRDVAQ